LHYKFACAEIAALMLGVSRIAIGGVIIGSLKCNVLTA
jgi:hypothetical protein